MPEKYPMLFMHLNLLSCIKCKPVTKIDPGGKAGKQKVKCSPIVSFRGSIFMKIKAVLIIGSMSFVLGTSAMAQSFTYDVVWQPAETVGGISGPDGPQGMAGSIKGSYTTKYEDGSAEKGEVSCVGMDQPDNGLFDIHMSCTATDPTGTSSLLYGCNFLGQPGPDTPLGCVGGFEGKTGETAGRRGGLTMNWYSDTQARGTGQFYGGQ